MAQTGTSVTEKYVSEIRSQSKRIGRRRTHRSPIGETKNGARQHGSSFPRHSVEKALRIPKAILEQNAGRECTPKEAASFLGLSATGPFMVEVSSATKYKFLERPAKGKIRPSDLARDVLRPKDPRAELEGYRQAVLNAPGIADVYRHYRGENVPDDTFLKNVVVDKYGIAEHDFDEFKRVFLESLEKAELLSKHGEKNETIRVVDVAMEPDALKEASGNIRKPSPSTTTGATDTCFVMEPFAAPYGDYYEKIYKPAIVKAGLHPVRADAEIFGTGKIIDQVWRGINAARVLVAELTTRNANVFYELGLAHALKKPVVLVSSNEDDVPFDLHHIRVIYYDVTDPFWGNKLVEKVAENILSAIKNPEEAIFRSSQEDRGKAAENR